MNEKVKKAMFNVNYYGINPIFELTVVPFYVMAITKCNLKNAYRYSAKRFKNCYIDHRKYYYEMNWAVFKSKDSYSAIEYAQEHWEETENITNELDDLEDIAHAVGKTLF